MDELRVAQIVASIVMMVSACGVQASCSKPESDKAEIFFGFDSAVIDSKSMATLDRLHAEMSKGLARPYATLEVIVIAGYPDKVGPLPYNLRLLQRRADAVKMYWIRNGVDANRVYAGIGNARNHMGESVLYEENADSTRRRRVAVEIFYGLSNAFICRDTPESR